VLCAADEDALTGREAVRLDDARRSCDRHRLRCGNAGRSHYVLRERLRTFDLSRGRARTEDVKPVTPQQVADPGNERRLGADDDEVDPERVGEREQSLAVLRADRMTHSVAC